MAEVYEKEAGEGGTALPAALMAANSYAACSALFAGSLIISNLLSVKIVSMGPVSPPAGILIYPLSYVLGDLVTEMFGYRQAKVMILSGFSCLCLLWVLSQISIVLPPAPFWHQQAEYTSILGGSSRVALAALISFLIGSLINSRVMSGLRRGPLRQRVAARAVVSTLLGQAADSVMFNVVAFGGVFGWTELIRIAGSGFALKVGYELLFLPFTCLIIQRLRSRFGSEEGLLGQIPAG